MMGSAEMFFSFHLNCSSWSRLYIRIENAEL